jgi:hypothetical protein
MTGFLAARKRPEVPMSPQLPSKPVYTAAKAHAGGGTGFMAVLMYPVGIAPDTMPAGFVLLGAILSMLGLGDPVDPALLQEALTVLWSALGTGAIAWVLVYYVPNKLNLPKPGAGGATTSGTIPPTLGLALALLVTAALLTGCDPTGKDQLQDLAAKANIEEDRGPAQRLADDLLGEAKGKDHRSLRLCMIFAGVSELMTHRVTRADPDYAPAAFGHISVLENVQRNLDATAANVWFETDVKLATLELASILVEVGQDRVPRLLGNLTGGVNVLGVVDRARVAARQAELAGAVIRDVRALIDNVAKGAILPEDAREACLARLDKNKDRIAALMGAG